MRACLAMLVLAAAARADVLILDGGAIVRGDVLKETSETVFVDLGYTVLEVPADAILDRQRAGRPGEAAPGGGLVTRGAPELAPGADPLARAGPAVALVSRPGRRGGGFVIRQDGYLVAPSRLVEGELEVTVSLLQDGEEGLRRRTFTDVEVVARNPRVDLALLRVDPERLADDPLVALPLAEDGAVAEGDPVIGLHAPLGAAPRASRGVLVDVEREQDGLLYLQSTIELDEVDSGTPLLDARGAVVGMQSWGQVTAKGQSLAIPAARIAHFVENRDAFVVDEDRPSSGYRYLPPPARPDS